MATDEQRAPLSARFRAWITDWGNALAVILVLYCAAYVLFQMRPSSNVTLRVIASKLAFLPLNVGAGVLALRASMRASTDPRVRRSLLFFAAFYGWVFLCNVGLFWVGVVRDGDAPGSLWNLAAFAGYLTALMAFLSMPMSRRVEGERWKFVLDVAMVMLGGGLVIWYFVIRPSYIDQPDQSAAAAAYNLIYPVLSLMVMTGVASALLRRPANVQRWAPGLLLAGWLIYLGMDLLNDLTELDVGFLGVSWLDYLYVTSYTLIIWSFRQYYWRVPEIAARPEAETPLAQPISGIPYAAVAAAYGLLMWLAMRQWPSPLSVMTVGTAALAFLMLMRQLMAVQENVRLIDERSARETERRLSALVQRSSDVIGIIDAEGALRYVSPSVTRIFGYQPSELDGAPVFELVHPDDRVHAESVFAEAKLPHAAPAPAEWRVRHRDGSWRDVETMMTNLLDEPSVRGIVLNTRDVSERRALQAQLTHQAFHDQLTGLANRALFLDRVAHALTLARRHQQKLAVVFLDLDNFKTVNDSLGHATGDRLLTIAAQRIQACVRTADTVARLGGDEFAVLLEDAGRDDAAMMVVERIVQSLKHPFALDGREVFATASLGIAMAADTDSAQDLVRNADMAMYLAKGGGKARFELFEPRMHAQAVERLELEADLRHAIEQEQFVLHYQPIVLLHTGEITGVEALVRWQHPRRGMIAPPTFIPIAEETGLIVPLGRWVVRDACRQAARWQRMRAQPLTLTVNVSGHQIQGDHMVEDVRGALEDSGLDPRSLVLEITESVLMQHSETLLHRLRALKSLGVRLAIDDFGTGYSSLGYLHRFPIDILKIDKSFVDGVGTTGSEPALARAVIALGETLRLQTIAEGIEQRRQLNGLQELGCEMGQGFYFARAVAPSAIDEILQGEGVSAPPPYERLVTRRETLPA